jgi:hypothetical protein
VSCAAAMNSNLGRGASTCKERRSAIGSFPLPRLEGGASPSSDDEEDTLSRSQSGRGPPTHKELAPADTKGAVKGFRVDTKTGVADGVFRREAGEVGSPPSGNKFLYSHYPLQWVTAHRPARGLPRVAATADNYRGSCSHQERSHPKGKGGASRGRQVCM